MSQYSDLTTDDLIWEDIDPPPVQPPAAPAPEQQNEQVITQQVTQQITNITLHRLAAYIEPLRDRLLSINLKEIALEVRNNQNYQLVIAAVLILFPTVLLLRATMAPPSPLLSKLKVALKLCISRLRMVQQKETAIAKINRRALAAIIESGKIESARIRVENIIREDINVELLEILELYCELLLARIGLMEAKEVDPGLEEAIQSVIYAAPRTDVKELQTVRGLLMEKYGKIYAQGAMENAEGKVAERVTKKLRVEPPSPELVELYMQEIAKAYHVHYPLGTPEEPSVDAADDGDDDQPGSGALLEEPLVVEEELSHAATPPRKINLGPKSPIAIAPASPTTENVRPQVRLPDRTEPKPASASTSAAPQTPQRKVAAAPAPRKPAGAEVDQDLLRRFAALKQVPKD
ncbi:uncharacterized protein DFL_003524 [Arthrobotrys flagrans]|uniref:DUF292-domain-containing protein n=1 Tax=Arthrobotrys flagrans TaxID=97331 RepID=A0A437A225_ARTFL|nr:hypothetical protein DFL_003524 [Arthrobotrys flagrans]